MSAVTVAENLISYDNPCAPLAKFSTDEGNDFIEVSDDELEHDKTQQSFGKLFTIYLTGTAMAYILGEHLFKSLSLEDLVKSFDDTINCCFPGELDENNISYHKIIDDIDIKPLKQDLTATPSMWSELIESLRHSLLSDLKLPHIAKNCQSAMNTINQFTLEKEIHSIDDVEEDELREQLDMHSVIVSNINNFEPFLTAEQVISEIDFILQESCTDMTPDSGFSDDNSDMLDLRTRVHHLPSLKIFKMSCLLYLDLKTQSIFSLNEIYEELEASVKELSETLVQQLAYRDELEFEKETKNTFISLILSIQNKRRQHQVDKRHKRRSVGEKAEFGMYLTTVIPFDRDQTSLSVEHLQSINKILYAINDDSPQVPELLTNYILKVFCPY
ncbi:unnamed protein product [Didymodactylos carnosus]|uniref:Uncharacterized protein n=1 Tax=Didymodactylos carnosus TaxID=1234261 RepID=A0A813ZL81_9BILA|nr:unnamed protein product [Didymodactylos carnosus]CAF3683108.1 unnamed protein product [Didymodactylos carnosus]